MDNITIERVTVHECGERWQAVIKTDNQALRAHLSESRGDVWVWWESTTTVDGHVLGIKMDEREVPAELADKLNALVPQEATS